jgi:hypothetical protein
MGNADHVAFYGIHRNVDRTPQQDQQDNGKGMDPGETQPGECSPDHPEEQERDEDDDKQDEDDYCNNRQGAN